MKPKNLAVRVRFAPSPTGPFHWGTARTAIFNWLFARKHDGAFVVRIEDTDKERSKPEFESGIFHNLKWLDLTWNEGPVDPEKLENSDMLGEYGPYRQSERTLIYKKYLEQLLTEGKVYFCYCTKDELESQRQSMITSGLPPKYAGSCRKLTAAPAGKTPQVIRFKSPETKVSFKDVIRGTITFDTALNGDFAIAKDLETPLFHFAVTIDDHLMQITHTIRGEDHISNTPRQILIAEALNLTVPEFAHLPLVLGQNREKLSKRHLEFSLIEYRDKGYLEDALINFIALLGWHPKEDKEVMTREELIQEFDLKRVQKGGAIFNEEKLLWLNAQHIKRLSVAELTDKLVPFMTTAGLPLGDRDQLEKIVALEQPRLKTLAEFTASAAFFFVLPEYDQNLIHYKPETRSDTQSVLGKVSATLKDMSETNWNAMALSDTLQTLSGDGGRGAVYWPVRVAMSGQSASPDPVAMMDVLGKTESLRRLEIALQKLHE